MGLAERRRIATIKDVHGPRFQNELNAALGFQVPFMLDATSFPENNTVLDCYDYYFESYGPGLVVGVMKKICSDDIGREAVKERLEKIVFQNTAKSPDEKGHKEVALDGKTLFIRESFYGYSDILFGEDDLRKAIEAIL